VYGLITRHAGELDWEDFDRAFYEVKDASGAQREPVPGAVSALSCFGDNAAARDDPSLVPVDEQGRPATAERPYFDWSYVCPSRDAYREGLLALVERCAGASPDVRLDDVGFPRDEYCRCDVCLERFAASDLEEWVDWRASAITEFVEEAGERVPGELYVAVHPDPYPGHLHARSGIDLDALAGTVDEVVVPLYDTAYGTTYWLEALASGFADRFPGRVGVELYAVDVDVDALIRATTVAREYGDAVYFGYDASNAVAALRRMRADERGGATHGDPG
jgi:hypothetical protein